VSAHLLPLRVYIGIFAALIVLTGTTVWVATIDLGEWNVIVALSIACLKALLVILYFMHVRYSSKLTWVLIGAGIFWFLIMVGFTMADYQSRSWI
jgi:cytochrome c oxidase subunit IV